MRIGAWAGRQQKFARLENRLKIASRKSECFGGQPEANGATFPGGERDLAHALEFQQGRVTLATMSRAKRKTVSSPAAAPSLITSTSIVNSSPRLKSFLFMRGLLKPKRL